MKRTLALVAAITIAGTVVAAGSASATGRGDTLRVTKECSSYDGTVGSFLHDRLVEPPHDRARDERGLSRGPVRRRQVGQ